MSHQSQQWWEIDKYTKNIMENPILREKNQNLGVGGRGVVAFNVPFDTLQVIS